MTEQIEHFTPLKHVDKLLLEADLIPLNKGMHDFNWSILAEKIKEEFKLENFSISPQTTEWIAKENVLPSITDAITLSSFHLTGIEGDCWHLISKDDIARLIEVLTGTPAVTQASELFIAFCSFLDAKILHLMSQVLPKGEFTLQKYTQSEQPPLAERLLSIELNFQVEKQTFHTRFLLSEALLHAWNNYFTDQDSFTLDSPAAENISLSLGLKVGQVNLTQEEWKKIKEGDFILLDKCFFDPSQEKGYISLTFRSKPLHHCRVKKDGVLKILETPPHS